MAWFVCFLLSTLELLNLMLLSISQHLIPPNHYAAVVVQYWNNIDSQLELDLDVIDDQLGDAKEVCAANPWLTYAAPLHRLVVGVEGEKGVEDVWKV